MHSDTIGRLEVTARRLEGIPELGEGGKLLVDGLRTWRLSLDNALQIGLREAVDQYDSSRVDAALDAVDKGLSDQDYLRASKDLAGELASFLKTLDFWVSGRGESLGKQWRVSSSEYLREAGSLRSSALRLEAAEEQRLQAREAVRSAEESASSARQAAGTAGEASLASWFRSYARSEHTASWAFRAVAFLGLAGTAGLAYWFFLESEERKLAVSSLVLRSAMVLAVAAFSTYSIRLAGQHRNQGNWAKSIAVQLNSFAAFLEPVESPAVRDAIYEQFANRVLGAPPDSKSASAEATVQVTAHDLISLIPKASSNPSS
jgi:hypothetical protein